MKIGLKKLLFGSLIAIGMVGCYPNNEITVSESDIVSTDYDQMYFEDYSPKTYLLPDTIGVIGGEDEEDQDLTREDMDEILALIKSRLDGYGWVEVDIETVQADALPDVVVTVDNLVATISGVGCIPWWGWYPWWPGWGGGWCYPTYLYSFTTGTLVIDMIDVELSNDTEIYVPWSAAMNGLLRSTREGNEDFIGSTINQAFDQSPYLERN